MPSDIFKYLYASEHNGQFPESESETSVLNKAYQQQQVGDTLATAAGGTLGAMGKAMSLQAQGVIDSENAKFDNRRPVKSDGEDWANVVRVDHSEQRSWADSTLNEHDLLFKVPDWGYDDFIYERQSWLKSLDSITGDPGLFYFKLFFQFGTPSGLFGSILPETYGGDTKNDDRKLNNGDSAKLYLKINKTHYTNEPIEDKLNALEKFTASLSFISSRAPWFFDSISGLDKAINVPFNKPLEDRYIEINCREDAVDMRLSTLMDLYRYAAYDYINLKEVIPQNLRQFDLIICLFHTPIRYYDTGMQTYKNHTYQYRRMNGPMENRMSYKMITLKGCEFDVESIGNIVPGTISNERGFSLGKSKIKITFKRAYMHSFNEWGGFLIGDDGVYYDKFDGSGRLQEISKASTVERYRNYGAEIWKPLVDASEKYITSAVGKIDTDFVFGNLYQDYTDVNGDYFKAKMYKMTHGKWPNEAQMPIF